MNEERIGTLSRDPDGGIGFAYLPEAFEGHEGLLLLSNSLPLRGEPFDDQEARPYFEGLLAQGFRRRRFAAELGLNPADTFGLLGELGGDCIGAVTIVPEGESIGARRREEPQWIEPEEVVEAITVAPGFEMFDPAAPARMRQSVPGEMHRLAFHREEPSGRWAWPSAALPSTHVLGPEPLERPSMMLNEFAHTAAYGKVGLPTPALEILEILEGHCLVARRFDRRLERGTVRRVHQETFAQALGYRPGVQPSIEEACVLARGFGLEQDTEALMLAALFDLLIGNRRSPAAGFSLIYPGGGGVALAPIQGIVATEVYEEEGEEGAGDAGARPEPIPLLEQVGLVIAEAGHETKAGLLRFLSLSAPLHRAIGDAAYERAGYYPPPIAKALEQTFDRVRLLRTEIHEMFGG